jgi:hypothetical protein
MRHQQEVRSAWRARVRILLLTCLGLGVSVASARAGSITLNGFNNNTPAAVAFDDGAGHSGSDNTLLAQFNVTLNGGGTPSTFNTFSVDLFHTATAGQTYAVTPRGDLATAFVNGSRMAYVFQNFGLQDLTNHAIQAAAVQVALWDLSLNNHNPTSFGLDADGTYSSGDENVFSVSFGNNADASQIAVLTAQYLGASIGAVTSGGWLEAAAAGNGMNRGESVLLQPVPGASSGLMVILGIGGLAVWGRWRGRLAAAGPRSSRRLRPR